MNAYSSNIPLFKKTNSSQAFTLSELLVSLSVLGLIAALTLPSVFNSVNTRKRQAVFKETLNAINLMAQDYAANGGADIAPYTLFGQKMNVKECRMDVGLPGVSGTAAQGCILQNGAVIYHLETTSEKTEHVKIDWNGIEGPNIEAGVGNDRITLGMNYGDVNATNLPNTVSVATWIGTTSLRPGEVLPYLGTSNANRALYEEIFN
jgi:prepilin-type N-terminal cleavage/methylation domain-containing protein